MRNKLPQLLDIDITLNCKPNDVYTFSNEVKLHCFQDKDSEIIRLEFLFLNAGSVNQEKFFSSAAASSLITEGCGELSAIEVADKLDYYAAYVERVSERDSTSLVFYFHKKYQQNLLPLIEKIIKQAETAAIPVENAKPRLPPSSSAIAFSSAARVGFPERA